MLLLGSAVLPCHRRKSLSGWMREEGLERRVWGSKSRLWLTGEGGDEVGVLDPNAEKDMCLVVVLLL